MSETFSEDGGMEEGLIARALVKRYTGGDGSELEVLSGTDLHVARGEAVAIIGESGAGKSSLLHVLGGLDRPTEGEVLIGGTRIHSLDEAL
jgi:ABC-type lipoprotein export system ATPase subunit